MDKEKREAIAILRHQIISPVLMDSGRSQMAYFRQVSGAQFEVPGRGLRQFHASTMKGWLNGYKKHGFTALLPKIRRDAGNFRRFSPEEFDAIKRLREEHLDVSVVKFYERALSEGKLGNPPMCQETLRRFLKSKKLYNKREPKARKRFEMGRFGELWTGDFMHGPQVLEAPLGKKKRKAILLAIIDDHSRLVVGAEFGFFENTRLIEQVFKDSILTYGLPDRLYVDYVPGHIIAVMCPLQLCGSSQKIPAISRDPPESWPHKKQARRSIRLGKSLRFPIYRQKEKCLYAGTILCELPNHRRHPRQLACRSHREIRRMDGRTRVFPSVGPSPSSSDSPVRGVCVVSRCPTSSATSEVCR